jgi:NADP-dependent 3-hydroxy acid dehydrogenase YdfG
MIGHTGNRRPTARPRREAPTLVRVNRVRGAVVAITGGGNGIGAALARRMAADGARVAVLDRDGEAAARVAADVDGLALRLDVADGAALADAVERIEHEIGAIDVFCANAGVGAGGGLDATNDVWQQAWQVNVLAVVAAARLVLPSMVQRGEGTFLVTASAAGLLTNLGNAPYSVTKHGAVALAEWLAITYGDAGIRVHCLCPMAVETQLLRAGEDRIEGASVLAAGAVLTPDQVADAVLDAFDAGRFLVLPHPEVATFERQRADDRDRWLRGMRRAQARLAAALEQREGERDQIALEQPSRRARDEREGERDQIALEQPC